MLPLEGTQLQKCNLGAEAQLALFLRFFKSKYREAEEKRLFNCDIRIQLLIFNLVDAFHLTKLDLES